MYIKKRNVREQKEPSTNDDFKKEVTGGIENESKSW